MKELKDLKSLKEDMKDLKEGIQILLKKQSKEVIENK